MSSKLDEVEIIESIKGIIPNEKEFEFMGIFDMWKKTKGEGVKIAVIDTGIDTNHEEFKESFKRGMNMINRSADPTDDSGHGSSVAGLIAGRNTGVAPNSELYIAKVLDSDGNGTISNVLSGITYAMNHRVDVLCMSLGSTQDIPIIIKQRIIDAHSKGITIVCSAGNQGKNKVNYPSNMEEVISVGGLDENMETAKFSNYGKNMDTVAPSVDILSAYKDGLYSRITGTSMASPIVAGSIALLISYNRMIGVELSPTDIKNKLKLLGEHRRKSGYGAFNLRKFID